MAHDANGKYIGLGVGDSGPDVPLINLKLHDKYQWARDKGIQYGTVYTEVTAACIEEFCGRVSLPVIRDDKGFAVANLAIRTRLGAVTPPPKPPNAYANTWFFSAPGSGADWWVGPSFDVGEWCKSVLGLNHQPVGFPKGGYLGLMGGDPGQSYNETIDDEGAEIGNLLDNNPAVQKALTDVAAGRSTDLQLYFSGYSQSADGMEDALVNLFGDGRKYAPLRNRINASIQFGNPSRQPGPTKVGNNPVGWGISRKVRPQWLIDVTWSITAEGPGAPDFYAACDDEIRPLFYFEIVQAETSLSFVEHIAKIALPVIMNLFGGLGGLSLGGLLTGALGGAVVGAQNLPTEDVDHKIIDLLSIKGVLENIPALFKLLAALPGIGSHGSYYDPHPEFGGRTGLQVACDAVMHTHR